jgi:DNA repair exonuclease SbcCD ATPase subunit
MKLLKLSLTNFCGWAKLDLDLSQYTGVVGILGAIDGDISHSNGSGKSSLVTAIIFALYGKQIVKNMDEFIMQGKESDGFKVVLQFEYNGSVYEVLRKKRANSQQKVQFKDISKDQLLAGEPESVIQMPLAVWSNTVYSEQGRLSGFVDQSPSARKDILTEIFGMRRYLQLEEKARGRHSDISNDLLRAIGERDQVKARAEHLSALTVDTEDLPTKLANVDSRISEFTLQITNAKSGVAANHAKLERDNLIAQELSALESDSDKLSRKEQSVLLAYGEDLRARTRDIKAVESKLAALKELPDIGVLQSDLQARLKDRDTLQLKMAEAEALKLETAGLDSETKVKVNELAHIDRKIAAFSSLGAKCPTCGTDLDPAHKTLHLSEFLKTKDILESEVKTSKDLICNNYIKLHSIEDEISELSALANSVPVLEGYILRAKSSADERAYLGTLYTEAQTRLQELKQRHMQELSDISETRASLKDKEASLKLERARFADLLQDNEKLLRKVSSLESDLRSATVLRDTLSAKLHKLDVIKDDYVKSQAQLAEAEASLAKLADAKFTANELIKAFGPSGIPTLILENCLAELQGYLDAYMDLLSDGKIKVTFKTTKTSTSTGKASETLAIMVSDINGERDISRYSGGERVRVYLAIRLALAKLMEQKSGRKIDFLIIDEISDLDDSGLNAFIQLLKTVDSEFGQIFLVSHLPELKNAFSGSLVLSRDLYGNYTKQP